MLKHKRFLILYSIAKNVSPNLKVISQPRLKLKRNKNLLKDYLLGLKLKELLKKYGISRQRLYYLLKH
ncbi:MAG: hypothetical protein ABIJ43_02055 [Candidatus Beckwithbacteria bacterium]|nr:hypothetical protein [Patescibacteria group bacterium]